MVTSAHYFDAQADGYDEEFGEDSVWAIAHRTGRRLLAEHLGAAVPGEVLDAGCGTGKWGVPFARAGARVTFADVAPNMVAAAVDAGRGNGPDPVGVVAPVEALPLPDAAFDLTLCMGDPLSYSPDPAGGIAELVRVTRPGGTILVSVDSRSGYLRIFKERDGYDLDALEAFLRTGDTISWEGLPLHTFTPDELRERFAAAGASCHGVWALPTVSAYFLFDGAFRDHLKDAGFRARLAELEWANRDNGAPGSHHLYGLFEVTGR